MPKEIDTETNDEWKCYVDEACKDTYPFHTDKDDITVLKEYSMQFFALHTESETYGHRMYVYSWKTKNGICNTLHQGLGLPCFAGPLVGVACETVCGPWDCSPVANSLDYFSCCRYRWQDWVVICWYLTVVLFSSICQALVLSLWTVARP